MALNIEFQHQSKRVRVSPGMTMFQVVESARDLFGLSASSQYELLHRNRPIDLSISFRLTGISNNAALELREAAGKGADAVQQVRVAVQLTNGKRVQEAFGSDATLEQILTALQQLPISDGNEFALTYMQREIGFDAFASTSLQDLGIVSGSAMFRVLGGASAQTRPPPVVSPPAASTAPELAAPKPTPVPAVSALSKPTPPYYGEDEEKQSAPPQPYSPPTSVARTTALHVPPPATAGHHDGDVEMKPAEDAVSEPTTQLSAYDALQLLRDSCFDTVSRAAILTLMKIITNILSYPENEKMRSIRVSNAAFNRNVGQHKGGIDFLLAIGFVFDGETQQLQLLSAEPATRLLENALKLLHAEAEDLSIQQSERPQVLLPVQVDASFDAFKPIITRLQAQPRGPSATEVLVDNLKAKQEELLQRIEKPARNTVVTFPGQQQQSSALAAQSNADLNATDGGPSDSSLVIASMRARRVEMEKAQNFRTQAMRELDELKRKKVFQQALIRVQFPDRVVVQAAFHPMETIADVIAHIRESLDGRYSAATDFYLYVSPPLQKLAPEKTLSDLGLVPAAHTYLSWIQAPQPTDEALVAVGGWYLRQDLLTPDQPDTKSAADNSSALYPNSIPLDESAAAKAAAAAKNAAAEAALKRASGGETKAKSGKKPSWLKL